MHAAAVSLSPNSQHITASTYAGDRCPRPLGDHRLHRRVPRVLAQQLEYLASRPYHIQRLLNPLKGPRKRGIYWHTHSQTPACSRPFDAVNIYQDQIIAQIDRSPVPIYRLRGYYPFVSISSIGSGSHPAWFGIRPLRGENTKDALSNASNASLVRSRATRISAYDVVVTRLGAWCWLGMLGNEVQCG
jgi:hypothetical protein